MNSIHQIVASDIGEFYLHDASTGHESALIGAAATEAFDKHNGQSKVRKVTQGPPPPNYKGYYL